MGQPPPLCFMLCSSDSTPRVTGAAWLSSGELSNQYLCSRCGDKSHFPISCSILTGNSRFSDRKPTGSKCCSFSRITGTIMLYTLRTRYFAMRYATWIPMVNKPENRGRCAVLCIVLVNRFVSTPLSCCALCQILSVLACWRQLKFRHMLESTSRDLSSLSPNQTTWTEMPGHSSVRIPGFCDYPFRAICTHSIQRPVLVPSILSRSARSHAPACPPPLTFGPTNNPLLAVL